MTSEIKHRVEQIRRGEVPEGYKRTRYGIYPINWSVKSVGDCIREYKELSNDIQSFPVYSSSRKGLMPQIEYYTQKEAEETHLGYKIVPKGFVTYRHMSDDDVFHFNINQTSGSILVSSEYPVFTSVSEVDLGFLIPVLNNTSRFRYFCRTQKLGGTRTRLYLKNLSQYHLGVPCSREQQKISAILTAQDRVIELKEKLLAEKQRQKKWLMQQLLSGQKRLPGFSGEWKSVIMGEIGATFSGLSSKSKEDFGQGKPYIPYINIYSNCVIDTKKLEYVRISDGEKQEKVKCGDIFFTTSSETPDEVGMSSVLLSDVDEVYLNSFCFGFRLYDFSVLLPVFAAQYFRGDAFRSIIKVLAQGATRYNLSKNNLLKCRLSLPSIREQTAIAEVLSTADREIELLRQDIEQEKQKKKALMQLLLTGIVRVKL